MSKNKIKQLLCFLFHRKYWKKEGRYNKDSIYYCSKCEWYFYNNPLNQEE